MLQYFNFLSKKLFPMRHKLSDKHSWAFPMEDRLHSIKLQMEQIAFGNETENALATVFQSLDKVKLLDRNVTFMKYDRQKSAVIDHVLDTVGPILVLEQKLKDNHDSTKNMGQFDDLMAKTKTIKSKYPGRTVIPVMYFLTDVQKGARKQLSNLMSANGGLVCYGKELFDRFFPAEADSAWEILDKEISELQRKDVTRLNYDEQEVISQVLNDVVGNKRASNRIRKILNDPVFSNNILPAISKEGVFKKTILDALDAKEVELW